MTKAYAIPTTPANTPTKRSANRRHTESPMCAAAASGETASLKAVPTGAASRAGGFIAPSELEVDEIERRAVADLEHAEAGERRRADRDRRPRQRPHVPDLVGG